MAIQGGEVIFNMSASFAAARVGEDRDAAVPELPPPDALPALMLRRHPSFELRAADSGGRLPWRYWIRCADALPDDPLVHAAVLTYMSDM